MERLAPGVALHADLTILAKLACALATLTSHADHRADRVSRGDPSSAWTTN